MMTFDVHEGPSSEFEDAYHDERELSGAILHETLGHVPRRPPVMVPETATVGEAIRAMNEGSTGCALVLRDGRLAGIFTERDVLRHVAGTSLNVNTTPVKALMTANPDTLPTSCSLAFALRKMILEGYRHIPLVNAHGTPVGVVSQRDIVGWMVELFPSSVLNLPPEPGYPQSVDGG